jgi:hypothetical protein
MKIPPVESGHCDSDVHIMALLKRSFERRKADGDSRRGL